MRLPGNSPEMLTKTSTMSVRLTPKIRYLADLAAREHDMKLTGFIELCIQQFLLNGSLDATILNGEFPNDRPPFRNEGLWDDDAGKRFFLLVNARPDLLSDSEQRLLRKLITNSEVLNKNGSVNRDAFSSEFSEIINNEEQ